MSKATADLYSKVLEQAKALPAMYGRINFSIPPERYIEGTDEGDLRTDYAKFFSANAKSPEIVEKIRTYTMLGDRVADPYAALMREYGFRTLIDMLVEACDKGIEKVADAPQELVALIHDMERVPE